MHASSLIYCSALISPPCVRRREARVVPRREAVGPGPLGLPDQHRPRHPARLQLETHPDLLLAPRRGRVLVAWRGSDHAADGERNGAPCCVVVLRVSRLDFSCGRFLGAEGCGGEVVVVVETQQDACAQHVRPHACRIVLVGKGG
eukprot:1707599-Pleurochrysis_carterae.AAC.2